jgi:hypothetical protein
MPKPDVEGEYVANIIHRQRDAPRSLLDGNLLRLYTLSPNSRYFIFVGLFCLALAALCFFLALQGGPDAFGLAVTTMLGGLLAAITLALPLVEARRIKRALQHGISTIGHVEGVKNARTTTYTTPEGMSNGAIRALVSYTVDGQPFRDDVFLDRPWVRDVQSGSQVELLVDPEKRTVLYVVGVKK